jgi:hypothetical protein
MRVLTMARKGTTMAKRSPLAYKRVNVINELRDVRRVIDWIKWVWRNDRIAYDGGRHERPLEEMPEYQVEDWKHLARTADTLSEKFARLAQYARDNAEQLQRMPNGHAGNPVVQRIVDKLYGP